MGRRNRSGKVKKKRGGKSSSSKQLTKKQNDDAGSADAGARSEELRFVVGDRVDCFV